MKYTKYLMNGDFINMDSFETDNLLFKVPLRLVSIPVAFVGGVDDEQLGRWLLYGASQRLRLLLQGLSLNYS